MRIFCIRVCDKVTDNEEQNKYSDFKTEKTLLPQKKASESIIPIGRK
jgi:hypothetical protein